MTSVLFDLVDPNGSPLDPAACSFASRALRAEEVEPLVRRARRSGRVLERDGRSIYGLGIAAILRAESGFAAPGVAASLLEAIAAIEIEAGTVQPVVLGALPFDSGAPAELVLPRLVVQLRDGAIPTLGACALPGDLDALLASPLDAIDEPSEPAAPPDHFELISVQPHTAFLELVDAAVEAVGEGSFDKVVVAREVQVRANRPFEPADLVARLRALYPTCATFSLDGFVGASPELLVRREGHRVLSHPLAGTIARSGDSEDDRRAESDLFASMKERSEHGIVVNAIVEELAKLADSVEAAAEPHLLELRNVVHLATEIEARLGTPAPGALEIALCLHPTPAVSGWPKAEALAWLAANEPLVRGRYAGPLGYMDASGDGEWWLGIRSAILDGGVARLIAGVGIVAGSNAVAELAETQLKLQALLAAAVRP